MDKKLAEYRSKKEREARFNSLKMKINNFFGERFQSRPAEAADEVPREVPEVQEALLSSSDIASETSSLTSEEETTIYCSYAQILYYILWFCLWAVLFAIFIQLQFGTVFLVVSGLVFMYLNTRTGPKTGAMSAYSVFNKNCESIDGTLKAEQFEREIRYGR